MNIEAKISRLFELDCSFKRKIDNITKRIDKDDCSNVLDLLDKRTIYRQFRERNRRLAYSLKDKRSFGDEYILAEYYREHFKKMKAERKGRGKKRFETEYRFFLHFYQASLGADYGTFVCEKCGHTFYHSPSTVMLATEKQYEVCCGNCVNLLLVAQGDKQLFY